MPGSNGIVRVLSPSAVHASLEAIVAAHRARGGAEVSLAFETAPVLAKRLVSGEAADIVIAPPKVMEELIGTGKAPSFRRWASCLASSTLNPPEITARPLVISDWTTGALIGTPSR